MISLTTSFQPALNKSGHAKLTFLGAVAKSGESQEKDRKTDELLQNEDGSPKMRPWSLILFTFQCKGRSAGTDRKVTYSASPTLDPQGKLIKILIAMGFKPPAEEVVIDEDGFEQTGSNLLGETDEDFVEDDGSSNEETSQAIENFINESVDKVFVGKVERLDNGYWNIDVDTLKPLGK